jgi:hypothetical protein
LQEREKEEKDAKTGVEKPKKRLKLSKKLSALFSFGSARFPRNSDVSKLCVAVRPIVFLP